MGIDNLKKGSEYMGYNLRPFHRKYGYGTTQERKEQYRIKKRQFILQFIN